MEDAEKIAKKQSLDRCTFSSVDVTNAEEVGALVAKCDVAISYVPAFLHIHIAKVCLDLGKNLVTASFVSP